MLLMRKLDAIWNWGVLHFRFMRFTEWWSSCWFGECDRFKLFCSVILCFIFGQWVWQHFVKIIFFGTGWNCNCMYQYDVTASIECLKVLGNDRLNPVDMVHNLANTRLHVLNVGHNISSMLVENELLMYYDFRMNPMTFNFGLWLQFSSNPLESFHLPKPNSMSSDRGPTLPTRSRMLYDDVLS